MYTCMCHTLTITCNYICIEGVSLLAADVDGSEESEVGADAGYPVLHLLSLLDLLKTFLYCLRTE